MTRSRDNTHPLPPPSRPTNFNGGAVIDGSGKEVPITEQMLQQVFGELIAAWEQAYHQRTSD